MQGPIFFLVTLFAVYIAAQSNNDQARLQFFSSSSSCSGTPVVDQEISSANVCTAVSVLGFDLGISVLCHGLSYDARVCRSTDCRYVIATDLIVTLLTCASTSCQTATGITGQCVGVSGTGGSAIVTCRMFMCL